MSDEMTRGLIFADSSWHSTRNLLATWPPVSADASPLLRFEPIDWQNARSRGIKPWNWGVHSGRVSRLETLVTAELPPGWMKSFPAIGQRPLAKAAKRWQGRLNPRLDQSALWITYPFYLALADQIKPDRLVYYNLDDYSLYWPQKADLVRAWEARALGRADWTVCVAWERARQLRAEHPKEARKIFHIPHSAPDWTIPEKPRFDPGPIPDQLNGIPRPILGYLGGLEERLDWALVWKLADEFPEASVVLVGNLPDLSGGLLWQAHAKEALGKPNVYATGSVGQRMIGGVYAAFDVNLIPYAVSQRFNQACSPTKLLDAMGSGRPTVATALPECRLYASLYRIAETHEEFLDEVKKLLRNQCRDGLEQSRWEYAFSRRSEIVLDALYRLTWIESADQAHRLLESISPIG